MLKVLRQINTTDKAAWWEQWLFSNDVKFLKGDAAITIKDIKVGDHNVIHAAKKDGKFVAAEVKVSATKGMHCDMRGIDMSGSKAPSH
jgi:hypothetical protein